MSQVASQTAALGTTTGRAPRFGYRHLWVVLFLGWVASYADRTVTGPVVAWMIQEKSGFIGDATNPATLGGLVGSMFFTGYLLTQYAGGRIGDKYGHRNMLVVSLLWAGVMTIVSGAISGLIVFVAARVLTGLGEGVFYSNDRTLVMNTTPPVKRTLGLGIVVAGLSVGLTIGVVATPYLIRWGTSMGWGDHAWGMPLFVLGGFTLVIAAISAYVFRNESGEKLRLRQPFVQLALYSAPTFVAILVLFIVAEQFGWPDWLTAACSILLALGMIGWVVRRIKGEGHAATLLSRDAWMVYIAFIAVMWNLWFFSFWSVEIVRESAQSSLIAASLTAAFNAGAGIIGFPVGGWIADRWVRAGRGRKPLAITCAIVHTLLATAFGLSVAAGDPSLWLLGLILFTSGLFFNALQPIVHSITGDLVPASERGQVFGMFNLVAEIGAVASPVVSGILRDQTGSWAPGIFLAAGIMAVSVIFYALLHEKLPEAATA